VSYGVINHAKLRTRHKKRRTQFRMIGSREIRYGKPVRKRDHSEVGGEERKGPRTNPGERI
jgi:hypothetical protein